MTRFKNPFTKQKEVRKIKECGATVTSPVRRPPKPGVVDGSRQMRILLQPFCFVFARVVELVDTEVSKTSASRRAGSSPALSTSLVFKI